MLILLVMLGLSVALLFAALLGVFGEFPDKWEWAAFIVGGIGLILAAPSIFLMLWGQPKVNIRIEVSPQGNDRLLVVYIENLPIKSRMLKRLGVRRQTVQSLSASLRIQEVGSGTVLVPIVHCRIYSDDNPDDTGRERITLPPTFSVAAVIMVAKWDETQKKAMILGDRDREPTFLGVGQYLAHMKLFIDGEPLDIRRQFMVGQIGDNLVWASS